MKVLWRSLLFLILLLPAVALFALFTEQGNRYLLSVVGHFAPLEIEYGSGTLTGRLNLTRIIYQTDSLRVELDDVVAELAPACLWRSALCFRQLRIKHLDIALLPGTVQASAVNDASEQEQGAELFKFPVPLESDLLLIRSMRVHWLDGEWAQGEALLRVRVSGSTIDVLDADIVAPRLELRNSTAGDADPPDIVVLPRINLPLELNVDALRLKQSTWQFYGKDYPLQSIELQGAWSNTRLQLASLKLKSGDLGQAALHGAVDFTGDWPVQADVEVNMAQAPQLSYLQGRTLVVSASGTFADLDSQLTAPGSPELMAAATLNITDRLLPFSVTLTATSPDDLLLADLLDLPESLADLQLEYPITASVAGNLDAQEFELLAAASGLGYPSLQLKLAGRHESGRIVIDELTGRDSSGSNELRGSGEVVLAKDQQWSLSLASNGLALPNLSEHAFGRLAGNLQLNGRVQDEQWQVQITDIDLRGDINNLPARINGFAGVGAGLRVSHSELDAELNGAQLSLRSSGDENALVRLAVSIDQLSRWVPGSAGQAEFQAEIAANGQQFQFSGSIQDIAWQGLEIMDGAIAGSYQERAGQVFKLDARFTDITAPGFELNALQVIGSGVASKHSLSVISQGDVSGQIALAGALLEQQWMGTLASTTLHTPHGDWQLSDALAMAWSKREQQLTVADHCWKQQSTQICPGELVLGSKGRGSLEMTGDMALLAGLLPSDVELDGEIQLALEGSWNTDSGVVVQGKSETRDLLLTQHYGEGESLSIGWDRGDIVVSYDRSGLHLDWQAQRQGRKVLGLTLLLPPDRDTSLSGAASFEQLQLAALTPFVPSFSRLEGQINGQLQLSGTIDQPLAHGSLTLSDGRLAMVANPTELDALELTLDVRGDWAQVRGSGKLGGGTLRLAGQLKTQPELRLELDIDGDKHNILYPPSTEAVVSEKLKVVASQGLLELSGKFTVHEGLLEFEQLPEGSVAVSTDVVEVDYTGNVIRQELPFDISMDVRVAIQDRFKLTGSLLQATLGGDLHLLQKPGRPLRLFGNLKTVGGELRAYQQRLEIERGIISFSGPPGNPSLDVRARRNISGSSVTVGVQVRGQLEEDLTLEVYSDPVMSQSEAVSYLVRGRGLDAGAGADGAAMALSMAGGVVNRSTIVSELNRIPGVSNVEFGAEGSEDDTAATVSGYIGGRIYLSYGVGLYEPINVMTARLYLRPRLWLEVVSRLENSVDLYYSFDIK